MAYTDTGLDAALDGIATAGTHIAVYDDTGAEISTRQETTWAAADAHASGGRRRVGEQVEFAIPAGTTVAEWGICTAATGGAVLFRQALDAPETFGSAGTLRHTPTLRQSNP